MTMLLQNFKYYTSLLLLQFTFLLHCAIACANVVCTRYVSALGCYRTFDIVNGWSFLCGSRVCYALSICYHQYYRKSTVLSRFESC